VVAFLPWASSMGVKGVVASSGKECHDSSGDDLTFFIPFSIKNLIIKLRCI